MGKYCTVCRESPVKPVYSSQGLHFILDYPSADYPTNYLNVTLFFCFYFMYIFLLVKSHFGALSQILKLTLKII